MFKLTALSVLGLLASAFASPAPGSLVHSPLHKRSVPSSPVFVIYSDDYVTGTLPAVADVKGYNVFALSFLWPTGPVDQAANWAELTAAQRSTALSEYHAAGIYVVASAFGSVPTPTTSGDNPTTVAQYMSNWVIQNGLDGIDVDYEDLNCFNTNCGAEVWLETFTTVLRQGLPQGQYILSHAPLAPWFSPTHWGGGGYLAVHKSVGNLIDWYNIQFYNQGTSEYVTCTGLLDTSSSTWPETAVFQISANGVPLNKLVIGKPATTADATNGYIDPGTLAGCAEDAVKEGWNAGIMVWQYPHADASWIATVRADAWPVGSGGSTTTISSKTTTTTTTTSTKSSGGSCSGVAAWSSSAVYTSGQQASYNGDLWTANQWNEDEVPGGPSGAWNNDGACPGATKPISPAASITVIATTTAFPPKGTFAYTAVAAQSA